MSKLSSLVCRCLIAGASGALLLSSSAYAAPYNTTTTCDKANSSSRSCVDNGTTVDVVKAKKAIGLGGAAKPTLTDCSQVKKSQLTTKDIKALLGSDGLVDVGKASAEKNVGVASIDLPEGGSLKIVFDRTSGEQLAVIRMDTKGSIVARVDYVNPQGTRCHKTAKDVPVNVQKPTKTATTPAVTTTTTTSTTTATATQTATPTSTPKATTAPTSSPQKSTKAPTTKPTATSVAPAKPTTGSTKATTSPTHVTKPTSTSPTTSATTSSATQTTTPSPATSTTTPTAKPAAETSGKQLAKTGGPVKAALLIAGALLSGGGALIYGARRGFSLR